MSAEQRSELVLRLLSKEEPAAQIARRAGISEQTLYRWRDDFIGADQRAMKTRGGDAAKAQEPERLTRKISERKQVIGELTIVNRILKKFSGESV